MDGKGIIIVTGATSGIGKELSKKLVLRGESVVLACRNAQKAEIFRKELLELNPNAEIFIHSLDLESLDSVRKFAKTILEKYPKIYSLVNNAGTMYKDYTLTSDAIEATVGVNYVATRLLTTLLLPNISHEGKLLLTGSVTYRLGKINSFFFCGDTGYKRMKAYYRSKLAVTAYALELSEKISNPKVIVIDPGVVNTGIITMHSWYDRLADIFFRPFIKTPQKASELHLRALFGDDDLHGKILSHKAVRDIHIKNKENIFSQIDITKIISSY